MTPRLAARVVRGECRLNEHRLCRPGDVVTRFGDVALTIRCDCSCHPVGRAGKGEPR
ncbi:hypothetical protein [Streptomyces sp. NPDC008121]|uniref:hypothetical protein n=1 Tax=Streptomyces sp. NPDC008121 TaxID=3364809 RepID=UPI0036E5019B